MTDSEIVKKVLEVKGMNASQLGRAIKGVKTRVLYDIMAGRSNLTRDLINLIVSVFPDISRDWLMTGEGNIFKHGNQAITLGDNSSNNISQIGEKNCVHNKISYEHLFKIVEEKNSLIERMTREYHETIKGKDEQLKAKDEQINRLIEQASELIKRINI